MRLPPYTLASELSSYCANQRLFCFSEVVEKILSSLEIRHTCPGPVTRVDSVELLGSPVGPAEIWYSWHIQMCVSPTPALNL